MKPEEEDRLREIARQVVPSAAEPEMSFVFEPETEEAQIHRPDADYGVAAVGQEDDGGWVSSPGPPGEDARPPEFVAAENSESKSISSAPAKRELPHSPPGLSVV